MPMENIKSMELVVVVLYKDREISYLFATFRKEPDKNDEMTKISRKVISSIALIALSEIAN